MKVIFDIQAGRGQVLHRALKYSLALLLWVAASTTFAEEDYSAGWGPDVGAPLPLLAAPDQSNRSRDLASLAGEQGLLLFLNRSADW